MMLARVAQVVQLLARDEARPRLAMRGVSMLPLFREGMVLELAGYARERATPGDVIVFREPGRLVAHRIVGFDGEVALTSGDAQPWAVERVAPSAVLGTVAAVYASDAPGARRLDDASFRARGRFYLHAHAARAWASKAYFGVRRALDALPRPRPDRHGALLGALTGYVRADGEMLARALEPIAPKAMADFAYRHGSATLLRAGLALVPGRERFRLLDDHLAHKARSSAARQFALRGQVRRIVAQLNGAGIPFALLKGAGRMYADTKDAFALPSHDVDVLVQRADAKRAFRLFLEAGYRCEYSAAEQMRYGTEHHHAAPLYPPKGEGQPLELHIALAPPGQLTIATDWPALSPHLLRVEGPSGPAAVLDPFATALHHAVHCVGFDRLRDVAVCAWSLLDLDQVQRERLWHLVASERRDPVRLQAVLAAAARMAGIPWPSPDPDVAAYLRWVAARENMPRTIGARTQAVEAWFAARRRWQSLDRGILNSWNDAPLRLAARFAIVPVAFVYAGFERRG